MYIRLYVVYLILCDYLRMRVHLDVSGQRVASPNLTKLYIVVTVETPSLTPPPLSTSGTTHSAFQ